MQLACSITWDTQGLVKNAIDVMRHRNRSKKKNMVIDTDTKVGKILKCLGGLISYVSAFSSGHDPRVLGLSDTLGSLLSGEPASPSPSATPPACALSFSVCVK